MIEAYKSGDFTHASRFPNFQSLSLNKSIKDYWEVRISTIYVNKRTKYRSFPSLYLGTAIFIFIVNGSLVISD